jgi:hypothetical protein
MKWVLFFALSLLTLNPIFAQSRRIVPLGANGKRVALVIGNDNYQSVTRLSNAVNDARAMAQVLQECGFEVKLVVNVNHEQMEKSVDDFTKSLNRGDVALFYYSGHGMEVKGENYLAPVDLVVDNESQVKYKSLSANYVLGQMEDAGADLQIMILDACRNNPFAKAGRAIGGNGLATMKAGYGTFISYATAPGQTADDNAGGANGLFTKYLLQALREPGLRLYDTFTLANGMVVDKSHRKQVPWIASSVNGDFYFRPGKVSATQPPNVTEAPITPPAPIRQSYCLPPPSGLVGWWPGEGSVNDIVSGSGPAAMSAVSFANGQVGEGFVFGQGGYMAIPASPRLANQRFTWSAWVRPDGGGTNDDSGTAIVGQVVKNGTTVTVPMQLLWRPKDSRFLFYFGNYRTDQILSANAFPPGAFYLVTATYDGAFFRLFVNGIPQGSFGATKNVDYSDSTPWGIGQGGLFAIDTHPRTWNGVIDEIQAFNRALSQSEIQSIFNAGSSGQCKPTGNSQ